jgi:menaquinone-dependent protoporphyrinogen IX oxidase
MPHIMQPLSREHRSRRSHRKTLILVAEPHGYTHAIARAIATRMRIAGQHVDVSDSVGGLNPPPDDYDAVILGAESARPRDRRVLGDYIASHRNRLQSIPTGLFILCGSGARMDPHRFVDAFETRVGLRARFAAVFSYGRMSRTSGLIRRILLASLRMLDGSVADRGVKELTALADAMTNELAKAR